MGTWWRHCRNTEPPQAREGEPVRRAAAGYAVDRVNAKLDRTALVYNSVRSLSDWSHTLRIPVVLCAVLALLLFITRSLTPRRGRMEIRRFTVVSESESGFAGSFDHLLDEEVARIARVFHSDQLTDIGAAVIRARSLDSGLSDIKDRALAAVEKGELKWVIGFLLAEMMDHFRGPVHRFHETNPLWRIP